MASETIVLGHESKIKIEGAAFGVRNSKCTVTQDEHEVGDTLTGKKKRHKGGRSMIEFECEFYMDASAPPNLSPWTIGPWDDDDDDVRVHLEIFVRGLGYDSYDIPEFVCFKLEFDQDVDRPVSGRISGKSDGDWDQPTT